MRLHQRSSNHPPPLLPPRQLRHLHHFIDRNRRRRPINRSETPSFPAISCRVEASPSSNCRRHFQARAMARSTCGSWPSRPGSRAPSGGRIYGRPLRLRRVSGITTRMLVAVSLMQSDAWAAWVMPHKKARTIGPGFALAQKRFSVQRGSRPNCPEPGAEADRRRDSCPPPPPEARRGRCCCCCCRGFGAARCGRG